MRKKNKEKSSLSKEEKELIKEMKGYLSSIGVPEKEWSEIILAELNSRRKSKKVGTSKFLGKIREKIGNKLNKFISKRMGIDQEDFMNMVEDPFKEMSSEEKQLFDTFFTAPSRSKTEDLIEHGASVTDLEEEKRMIVYFDEEE